MFAGWPAECGLLWEVDRPTEFQIQCQFSARRWKVGCTDFKDTTAPSMSSFPLANRTRSGVSRLMRPSCRGIKLNQPMTKLYHSILLAYLIVFSPNPRSLWRDTFAAIVRLQFFQSWKPVWEFGFHKIHRQVLVLGSKKYWLPESGQNMVKMFTYCMQARGSANPRCWIVSGVEAEFESHFRPVYPTMRGMNTQIDAESSDLATMRVSRDSSDSQVEIERPSSRKSPSVKF